MCAEKIFMGEYYRRDNISYRLRRFDKPQNHLFYLTLRIRDHLGYWKEVAPGIAGVHDRINLRSARFSYRNNQFYYGTRRSRENYSDRDQDWKTFPRHIENLSLPWSVRLESHLLRRIRDRWYMGWRWFDKIDIKEFFGPIRLLERE